VGEALARRPTLYSAARALRIFAVVLLLVIAVFLAAVAESAAQIRPGSPSNPTYTPGADNTVLLASNVTLQNPGAFAIDRLSIQAQVRAPGPAGALLASGGSPIERVGAGVQVEIPLRFTLPLVENTDLPLLTQDLVLPSIAWVNATYATIFSVRLVIPHNYSWGAPFANLSVTLGHPSPGPNGTTVFPFTVAFSNDAYFADDGTLAYRVNSGSGAECARQSLALALPPHSPERWSGSASVADACVTPSSQFVLSYASGPWQVAFNGLSLP
jgi:hypothetical protein